MDNETRTTLILPPDLAAMVDDYWHAQRLNTRNEAIRQLLRLAFSQNLGGMRDAQPSREQRR